MKQVLFTMLSVCTLVLSIVGSAFAAPGPPPEVPEPSTLFLLGLGAAGLVVCKKFKK
jgi:hypothetical protein